jgi:hypothetical protein
MTDKVIYTEIKKLHAYKIFKKYTQDILIETITNFFNCSVEIIVYPKKEFLSKYDINIDDNINRGFYPINETSVLILGRMFRKNQLISAVGFKIEDINVSKYTKILNDFENVLTHFLTLQLPTYFEESSIIFGDFIIKETIVKYISSGSYDSRQIRHLLQYFFKLRTTSFEGSYFSTGAIFTKSTDILEGKRYGTTIKLDNPFKISNTNNIDKRIWYLVDGKTSFFLGNKDLLFKNLFTTNEEYSKINFLDNHSLALTLKGGDFVVKIESEKLFTITTADSAEFSFFENKWRYRNYSVFIDIIKQHVTTDMTVVNKILFYTISCSKKQLSTILWFPEDLDNIDEYINTGTKNNFLKQNINITDSQYTNHIFRCLSSDGASIIDKFGNLLYLGVIVNLDKAKVSGIAGTGESAASILKSNGLSIKISSDGMIKMFMKNKDKPFYF